MAVMPSQMANMIENQLGDAMTRLRQQMQTATGDDLDELTSQREDVGRQLRRFMDLHMDAIDKDPKVASIRKKLSGFTLEIGAAVQEMRNIKSAIERATKVVAAADQALSLLAKFA